MALGDHLYNHVLDQLKNFPGNYLEIGVFDGDGFAKIAETYPEKTCYALDPFIEDGHTSHTSGINKGNKLSAQKEKFIEYTKNFNNVVSLEETSVTFFTRLSDSLVDEMNISIVVIDGSHYYSDVVNDINLSIKLLSKLKQGIIIFDDLHIDDVNQAHKEFLLNQNSIIKDSGFFGNSASFAFIQL